MGVLVTDDHDPGRVRINFCKPRPQVLDGTGMAANFALRGGLLTWDSGHKASEFYSSFDEFSRGSLTSYEFATGQRSTWTLPKLSLRGGEYPSGVFGYSTHTSNMVFWIASRVLNGPLIEVSSVYASRVG
jgi:hypothetical protein